MVEHSKTYNIIWTIVAVWTMLVSLIVALAFNRPVLSGIMIVLSVFMIPFVTNKTVPNANTALVKITIILLLLWVLTYSEFNYKTTSRSRYEIPYPQRPATDEEVLVFSQSEITCNPDCTIGFRYYNTKATEKFDTCVECSFNNTKIYVDKNNVPQLVENGDDRFFEVVVSDSNFEKFRTVICEIKVYTANQGKECSDEIEYIAAKQATFKYREPIEKKFNWYKLRSSIYQSIEFYLFPWARAKFNEL